MKTTPVYQSLETPTETDTPEHFYHKPVSDVDELKWHLIETGRNQQSFIDQVTYQWRDCFSACLKAKSKRFEHLYFSVTVMTF